MRDISQGTRDKEKRETRKGDEKSMNVRTFIIS